MKRVFEDQRRNLMVFDDPDGLFSTPSEDLSFVEVFGTRKHLLLLKGWVANHIWRLGSLLGVWLVVLFVEKGTFVALGFSIGVLLSLFLEERE